MKALIQRTASVPRCPPRMAHFGAGQLDLKGTGWGKKKKKHQPKAFPTFPNLYRPPSVRKLPIITSPQTANGQFPIVISKQCSVHVQFNELKAGSI